MNRLHISEISSIGAVEEGDDPEATIMLWKARPDKTAQVRSTRRGMSMGSPAAWGKVVERIATDRMAEQQQALAKTRDDYQDIRRDIQEARTMTPVTMTAKSIADTVQKRAEAMRQQPQMWDKSEVELRAELWRRTPGLRDVYTAAMRDPDGFAKSESGDHADALRIVKAWKDDPAAGL